MNSFSRSRGPAEPHGGAEVVKMLPSSRARPLRLESGQGMQGDRGQAPGLVGHHAQPRQQRHRRRGMQGDRGQAPGLVGHHARPQLNNIGDEGGKAIADKLPGSSVTTLSLYATTSATREARRSRTSSWLVGHHAQPRPTRRRRGMQGDRGQAPGLVGHHSASARTRSATEDARRSRTSSRLVGPQRHRRRGMQGDRGQAPGRVTTLNLTYNIGDEGCKTIADKMAHPSTTVTTRDGDRLGYRRRGQGGDQGGPRRRAARHHLPRYTREQNPERAPRRAAAAGSSTWPSSSICSTSSAGTCRNMDHLPFSATSFG